MLLLGLLLDLVLHTLITLRHTERRRLLALRQGTRRARINAQRITVGHGHSLDTVNFH